MPNFTIKELLGAPGLTAAEKISALKEKSISVPAWGGANGLYKQYDPNEHPVMNKSVYPDIVDAESGRYERVTRITYDLQRLATKRMTELMCGIPVKRIYKPQNDRQAEVAKYLEALNMHNHIDSVNIERYNMLFAGCEVMTLWYAVEQKNALYGFDSPLKFRCRNFSPMLGDNLYPLFDEYGDMVAMSVGYTRKVGRKKITFFDTYTADKHIKFSNEGGEFAIVEDEDITVGKIPCVYAYRPTPIWEDTSKIVYEMEWAMSRNGNYLRRNSKPLFVVFADEEIRTGEEPAEGTEGRPSEGRSVLQYPKGSSAAYVTWQQAVDNLKFYITELRQTFFTQLQLPDWSYDNMKTTPMSGEARKQMYIDCQLKVKDESGRLVEFHDREINVQKAFLKTVLGEDWAADIEALPVENVITAFTVNDEKDTISNLMSANGGKALMSQRESIAALGWSDDVEETMRQIAQDNEGDVFNPYE